MNKKKSDARQKFSSGSSLILGRALPSEARRQIGFTATNSSKGLEERGPGELITYSGDSHLITIGASGSGKTAGPVITNMLNYRGPVIAIDLKGEIAKATARHRQEMGQKVYILDFRDGMETASINPLDLAALCGSEPAAVARAFAAELINRTGQERDRFWNDISETTIAGAVTWLMTDCPPADRRLSKLFDLFTADDVDFEIAKLLDQKCISNRAARAAFVGYLSLPERETRPSALATTLQHLRLFDTELVRKITDTTSVDLAGLVAGEPIYPSRLKTWRVEANIGA